MKAIEFRRYGGPEVLTLTDVDEPAPGDLEVLVRVRAASLNPVDWHLMEGLPTAFRVQFGLREPRITRVGADLAGEVVSAGPGVLRFRSGDEVFGSVGERRGVSSLPELGSCAELVRVPERLLAPMPAGVGFEAAAAAPTAGYTALQALRDHGRVRPGQRVLVNGASGGVGTFAVQIAKVLGAEVTGVCSTRNVELVSSLGADHVIDYTTADFALGDVRYDMVLDNVGNRSLSECRRALTSTGVYVASFGRPEHRRTGPVGQLAQMIVLDRFVDHRLVTFVARPDLSDLLVLRKLLESGVVTAVIDRTYPLAETAEAMRHLETGHARGKVVITV